MPSKAGKPDLLKEEGITPDQGPWIMARLRHEDFFSLRQLNERISELLIDLNQRQMKKHPGSRLTQFEQLDKPVLKPLPLKPYIYTQVKPVRVHIDYHVEVDKHYYSVPHALIKQKLEAHICGQLVTLYHQDVQVAVHPRSYQVGRHTTSDGHMPISHQKQSQWSPQRFEQWASNIGESTTQVVQQFLASKKHPEQSYRVCLGLLSLSKKYTPKRLEDSCHRALSMGLIRLAGIRAILLKGLDSQPLPTQADESTTAIEHTNLRGKYYYH